MNQPNSIAIAPGEVIRFSDHFCPNMILTHLTTTVVLTDKRIIVRRPNTLFGIIPVGYNEHSTPVGQIAQISAGESFSSKLIAAAAGCLLVALYGFVLPSPTTIPKLLALLLLAIAVFLFFKAHNLGLVIRNTGAGVLAAAAARSERNKLAYVQATIRDLLFGDGSGPAAPPLPDPYSGPVIAPAAAPRFTAAQASNPTTPQSVLSQIAEHEPSLRGLVAANPNCYPGLIEWLRMLDDPDVNRALSSRSSV